MRVERVEGMTLELDVGADEDGEGGKDVLVTSNATQKITEVSYKLQANSDSNYNSSSARARGVAQVSLVCINISQLDVGKRRIP